MTFTKTHYEKIAEIIKNAEVVDPTLDIMINNSTDTDKLINGFIKFFKPDNDNFDEKKFTEACFK